MIPQDMSYKQKYSRLISFFLALSGSAASVGIFYESQNQR